MATLSLTINSTTPAISQVYSTTIADADLVRLTNHLKNVWKASTAQDALRQSFKRWLGEVIRHAQDEEVHTATPATTPLPFTDPA